MDTKLPQLHLDVFLALFDPIVHATLANRWALHPDAEAFVVFENLMLDSSACGERTAVVVGPSCTFKSVAWCEGKWLNDLPSQRQYAVGYCVPPRPWTIKPAPTLFEEIDAEFARARGESA